MFDKIFKIGHTLCLNDVLLINKTIMEEKIDESFNPVYHSVEQVIRCTSTAKEPVVDAQVAVVIGHNGRDFVSSTDWRLTTKSGRKRIFPFSIRPQYPNFLECVAGVAYKRGKYSVITEEDDKPAKVMIGEKVYEFAPGKALKIYAEPGHRFIATDCAVEYQETPCERIYRVVIDEDTLWGKLDEDGTISRDE